ncbi:MAG: hypothetical protein K7J46_03630 [Bryobacter sp.]|jgi:hypothetical protein|nr:hypothetical protein [Bryobacter sp. CoA8 C33]
MDRHVRPAEGNQRKHFELDYLATSHQIIRLLELRVRDRQALTEINRLIEDLSAARADLGPEPALKKLDEVTLAVLNEVDTVVRLGMKTSSFRDQFRLLHSQLNEIGARLGYC